LGEATLLLKQWAAGDKQALAELMTLLYDELRRRANLYLSRERINHTLQPTALIHESYLRLINQQQVEWRNRAHFFAVASQIMRHILVDHARNYQTAKRGNSCYNIALNDDLGANLPPEIDLIVLDDALARLARMDALQSQIVELRFFGGLSIEETAAVLEISARSVNRSWQVAKAWLYQEVKQR
jgi:RNA polymerase sigma factor (TIGR02999 family)